MIFTLNNSSRLEKITAAPRQTKAVKPLPAPAIQQTFTKKPAHKPAPKMNPAWAMTCGIGD